MPDLTPPPDLSPAARHVWDEVHTRLVDLGLTDRTDPDLLRVHVEAVTEHRRYTTLIAATDVLTERDGKPVISPAVTGRKQAAETIARTSKALGLNRPAARVVPIQAAEPMRGAADLPFPGAWRCPDHDWWHGTCHRKGGAPCHGKIPAGLSTCRMHPGRNGKVKHLAAKAQQARQHWQPVEMPAAQALMEEVWYWSGLCVWLDEVVDGLQRGDMVWGLVRRTASEGGEFPGVTIVEQSGFNTWVQWQEQAHKQRALVAKMAMDGEADASMVRIEQAKGMMLFRLFQEALNELHLDQGQWAIARETFPRLLKGLTAA
jgi:P27 family predicted phage terminase small subunit